MPPKMWQTDDVSGKLKTKNGASLLGACRPTSTSWVKQRICERFVLCLPAFEQGEEAVAQSQEAGSVAEDAGDESFPGTIFALSRCHVLVAQVRASS